jgi:hypothetical protein
VFYLKHIIYASGTHNLDRFVYSSLQHICRSREIHITTHKGKFKYKMRRFFLLIIMYSVQSTLDSVARNADMKQEKILQNPQTPGFYFSTSVPLFQLIYFCYFYLFKFLEKFLRHKIKKHKSYVSIYTIEYRDTHRDSSAFCLKREHKSA